MNSFTESNNSQLTEQLAKIKIENERKRKQIENLLATDPQIKEIKKKIQISYLTKERARQLADKQIKNLNQKVQESHRQLDMIRHLEQQRKKIQKKEEEMNKKKLQNQKMIQKQIELKQILVEQARNQFEKERNAVNNEVQKLIDADKQQIIEAEAKKRQLYNVMLQQYQQRQKLRRLAEIKDKEELKRINDYQERLDNRDKKQKLQLQAKEKEKEVIYLRLRQAEEKRQKQMSELQNMRIQFYQFQREEEEIKKDEDQLKKKEEFKKILREAIRQNKQMKEKQKQQEHYLQKEFKKKLMERLAESQKIQQMAHQKKRLKQLQHRKQVQRLWEIKLSQYRQIKQAEQREREQQRMAELWKIKIIESEKERIIKEHAHNLQGFLHPDLIQRAQKIANYENNPSRTNYLSNYQV